METPTNDVSRTTFTKPIILKNLAGIAIATLLLFWADDALLTYQSTLNQRDSVGIASMSVQFAFSIISSFFLPKFLILRYGCKAIMVLSIFTFIPFFAANYYPEHFLMIFSSALVGVGNTLFMGSADTYINELASLYDKILAENKQSNSKTKLPSVDRYRSLSTEFNSSDISFSSCQNSAPMDTNISSGHKVSNSDIYILPHQKVTELDICSSSSQSELCVSFQPNSETCSALEISFSPCQEISEQPNFLSSFQKISKPDITKKHANLVDTSKSNISDVCMNDIKYINVLSEPKKNIYMKSELVTGRFFSCDHSMIYQTSSVWGNIMSFVILQMGYSQKEQSQIFNGTCVCGAAVCNGDIMCLDHNFQVPSTEMKYLLVSICIGLCILSAVIIVAFLDVLHPKEKNVTFSLLLLFATFRQARKKNHILLIPLSVHNGMMNGFYLADFTKSYIGCSWGISHIGIVTAWTGLMMAIASTTSGWFVTYFGRLPIFIAVTFLNLGLDLMLLLWHPDTNQPAMIFLAAGLWGGLFGTFYTQVRDLYAVLFKEDEEASFIAYQLWHCIGACLSLGYSNFICDSWKLYILITFSTLGFLGYLVVERSHSLVESQHSFEKEDTSINTKKLLKSVKTKAHFRRQ